MLGATDKQISDFLEITEETLNQWKHKYPEFSESLKGAKSELDTKVEQSLYRRARGYSHKAIHFDSFKGDVTETEYTERYPPDTTACIFWLKNRQPAKWRDKQELEHSGALSITVNLTEKKGGS